ncbi:uncharacterized protein LOC102810366 [Saccoglossus kowalevskii]|uniref:Uncharacterized protein LOC102810366 n=1 Tax=Saccoglossus kowalevskii TaxID=10224 RepID=A0ABM0LY50_SACKO|nr:PREDICTED: uncharacterized protein LOC102810366 [Saccoglossus kowalevskii]
MVIEIGHEQRVDCFVVDCRKDTVICITTATRQHTITLRLRLAVLATEVKTLMSERNISSLYVTLPTFARGMITILKEANVSNVVTREDLTDTSFPVEIPDKLRLDNYHTALLEQEICIKSDVFLWHMSTFSRMVHYARIVQGTETIKLSELLTWRYPDVALRRK